MNRHDEHIGCTFDAFCKRTLRNESVNAHLELDRLGQQEVNFSALTWKEERQLQYIDAYAPERQMFAVLGTEVEITDGALVRALTALSRQHRDIVLLAYLLDLSDEEIARRLALSRSTVQYRRTSILTKLRKLMEEYDHDEERP